jgi:enoyl-CoA hydratase
LDALDRIEDADVKALMVRGAGGVFSAGADLVQVKSLVEDGDRARLIEYLGLFQEVTNSIRSLAIPTLAAVEGYALAGGFELLLACDMAVATTEARIGDQHANYGLVAGFGGTQRITEQVSRVRAKDLMFTGRHVTGETAEAWGLVSRAFEPDRFEEELRSLEDELAAKSRDAATLTKDLTRIGRGTDGEIELEIGRRRLADHLLGKDAMDGLEAFEAGREPEF